MPEPDAADLPDLPDLDGLIGPNMATPPPLNPEDLVEAPPAAAPEASQQQDPPTLQVIISQKILKQYHKPNF